MKWIDNGSAVQLDGK